MRACSLSLTENSGIWDFSNKTQRSISHVIYLCEKERRQRSISNTSVRPVSTRPSEKNNQFDYIVQWRGESKAYIQLFCVCKLWYRLLIVKYYISHILLQVFFVSFAISEWRTKKLYHKVRRVTFKNRIIRVVYWKYFDFFFIRLNYVHETTHSNFLYWIFFRETSLLRNQLFEYRT